MKKKPKNYKWSFENCKKEALKYDTRYNFYLNASGAHESARKNKWLNIICNNMDELRKPKGYWTFKNCKEETLKYKTKQELKKNNSYVYHILIKNNYFKDGKIS